MRKIIISLVMLIGLVASLSAVETEIELADGASVTANNPESLSSKSLTKLGFKELPKYSLSGTDNVTQHLVAEAYIVSAWYDDLEVHYIFTSETVQKYLLADILKGEYTKDKFLNDVKVIPWFGWNNSSSNGIYYLYADYMFK